MTDLFLEVLNRSITAGWVILAVILFRLLFRRAPKKIICCLWGVAALRLLLPFTLESVISLIPSGETVSPDIVYSSAPSVSSGVEAIDRVINPVIRDTFSPEPAASINPLQILTFAASVLWLIGIAVILTWGVIGYLRLRRRVAESVPYEREAVSYPIRQCEGIVSPFILGILRPKIYIPFHMKEETLGYVLKHETMHLRRKDHLFKLFGYLLVALYWFHPLVWAGYLLFCRDIEFACDESVIRGEDDEGKRRYASALLTCKAEGFRLSAVPLAFGEVGIGKRIKNTLNYKKPAVWLVAVSVILSAVLTGCLLTDPKSTGASGEQSAQLPMLTLNNIAPGGDTDAAELVYKGVSVSDSGEIVIQTEIKNSGTDSILFGAVYYLQYWDGEAWGDSKKEGVEPIFVTVGYQLSSHRTKSMSYAVDGHFYDLSRNGRYRLLVPLTVEEAGEKKTQASVWLEFEANWSAGADFDGGEVVNVGASREEIPVAFRGIHVNDKGRLILELIFTNRTGSTLCFGTDYKVQYREGGEWVDCEPIWAIYHGFPDIAYEFSDGVPCEESFDVSLFNLSRAGRYRLVKTVDLISGDYIWAEFELKEGRAAPEAESSDESLGEGTDSFTSAVTEENP